MDFWFFVLLPIVCTEMVSGALGSGVELIEYVKRRNGVIEKPIR